jgi:hypothetical protein
MRKCGWNYRPAMSSISSINEAGRSVLKKLLPSKTRKFLRAVQRDVLRLGLRERWPDS